MKDFSEVNLDLALVIEGWLPRNSDLKHILSFVVARKHKSKTSGVSFVMYL